MKKILNEKLNDIFLNNVYKTEFGNFNIILEEFIDVFETYSTSNKIKIICLGDPLKKETICDYLENCEIRTIETNLLRLNKSLELSRIGSKPYQYKTDSVGIGKCNTLFVSFARKKTFPYQTFRNIVQNQSHSLFLRFYWKVDQQ
jgi:hypothetical protein